MENKKNMVIIVVFSLLAIITVIGFTMYTEEKQRVKPKNNTTTVTATNDEDFYSNIEVEEEKKFEQDYDLVEKFINIYSLRANGSELLYTEDENKQNECLMLYKNSEEKEKKFKKSEKIIEIDGNVFSTYETQIEYEKYKENLLKIMSEEIFEKYFTEYIQNIAGMLYITNETNENVIIESLEAIDDDKYNLRYNKMNEIKESIIIIEQNSGKIIQINI